MRKDKKICGYLPKIIGNTKNMKIIQIYLVYFIASIWLTIRVGNSLHRHGRPWIISLIGDEQLSDRINDLLLLGYRLVNIGYLLITLMTGGLIFTSIATIIEFLSIKLGMILMLLAGLHFQNIFLLVLFSKLKSKYKWQL
jgi:hypothetical protein